MSNPDRGLEQFRDTETIWETHKDQQIHSRPKTKKDASVEANSFRCSNVVFESYHSSCHCHRPLFFARILVIFPTTLFFPRTLVIFPTTLSFPRPSRFRFLST